MQYKQLLKKEQIRNFYTYEKLGEVFENMEISTFKGKTRAFVKIQDGCENFCSYCIIPYARGRERSMPLEEVIEASKKLVASGHKEIVLSGIHTGRKRQSNRLCRNGDGRKQRARLSQ